MLAVGCAHTVSRESRFQKSEGSRGGLKPFQSVEALRAALAPVAEARRVARQKELAKWRDACRSWNKSDTQVEVICSTEISQTMSVSASSVGSITNNQHAGVDEGDIVKRLDDMLIVLRRGRLFTIGVGPGRLQPLSVADAFGPFDAGAAVGGTWYDELVVWQRTAIVIGYNYKRRETEIGLFDVGDEGDLRHQATYHLRSSDYYSGSNYASRLIGDRLLLFTSLPLPEDVDPNAWLPTLRRWDPARSDTAFENIAPINRVFQPAVPLGTHPTIHTLTSCDLSRSFACEATVVLGDQLTEYYASRTAVYAWTTGWERGAARSMLYRIPFDGSVVSAVGVDGRPSNQLGFLEDTDHLNVVVTDEKNRVALLRLPLFAFSDGSVDTPGWLYRSVARGEWVIARYVGRHVLIGTPDFDPDSKAGRRLFVAELDGPGTASLTLPHSVERIEAMGTHAVVVGTDADSLLMTPIRLGNRPAASSAFVYGKASQSEGRSHAFFYRQDTPEDGIFGLPIATSPAEGDNDRSVRDNRILFIRNRDLALAAVGTLDSSPTKGDDGCLASCVDWYGEARPIFIGDRIFGLRGYDLAEARLVGQRLERLRRLDFTPRGPGR